jgi:HK97 family phage major capsid protein
MNPELAAITEKVNELTQRVEAAVAAAEADPSKHEESKALVESVKPQLDEFMNERQRLLRDEEFKGMKAHVESLQKVMEELRKPAGSFMPGHSDDSAGDVHPYIEGKASVFSDIKAANRNNVEARQRLTEGVVGANAEGKAMTEGVAAQGGYLVQPTIERRIVEAIELNNVMRQLCSTLNVTTNQIQLDQIGLTTTAGWVAELAQKPETTGMTLASVTASVFTAAGLATISNQLLADSNPAVDQLVTADLVKRLAAVEETAFLAGTGTGQPLGLLNTSGLGATALTSAVVTDLTDAILSAIGGVLSAHGSVNAIVMHPRTWTRILLAKNTAGSYIIDPTPPGNTLDVQSPRTFQRGPQLSIWGYPVVLTNRMPTNLGGGTNESRVIVGDFSEALILDRQGVTLDESQHVYFLTNQTVFRAEKRVGFTAARTPSAFNIIGGAGLANG